MRRRTQQKLSLTFQDFDLDLESNKSDVKDGDLDNDIESESEKDKEKEQLISQAREEFEKKLKVSYSLIYFNFKKFFCGKILGLFFHDFKKDVGLKIKPNRYYCC